MVENSSHNVKRSLSDAERKAFVWLDNPAIRAICAVLETEKAGCVRFVGGCVRDSLLLAQGQFSGADNPQPKTDIDLATQLAPQRVMKVLRDAGIKTVPTGIDHGTVTAIHDGQVVEITTLRKDVETDGRRASIAYTDDWVEDACRRDFTINALYLTPNGVLHDPVNGLDDLSRGKVRFIGDPITRIREDYLRILRFFRFTARFSSAFDTAGMAAIDATADHVSRLSAERICSELMKILDLPRVMVALAAMDASRVLQVIWPAPSDLDTVRNLRAFYPQSGAIVTLAALYTDHSSGLAKRLRFSNRDGAHLTAIIGALPDLATIHSERHARACLYRLGDARWRDGVSLYGAKNPTEKVRLDPFMDLPKRWAIPSFPLKGGDLIARGLPAGPAVSAAMSAIEQIWISRDFPGDDAFDALVSDYLDANRRN